MCIFCIKLGAMCCKSRVNWHQFLVTAKVGLAEWLSDAEEGKKMSCICSLDIGKFHDPVFFYVKCFAGRRLSCTIKNGCPFVKREHLTKQQKNFLSSVLSLLCTTLCLSPGTPATMFVPQKSWPISTWSPFCRQILIFLMAMLITVLGHDKQSLSVIASSPWLAPWPSQLSVLETYTLPPYLVEFCSTQLLQLTLLWKKYSLISHSAEEDPNIPGLAGNAVCTMGTDSQQFFFHPH